MCLNRSSDADFVTHIFKIIQLSQGSLEMFEVLNPLKLPPKASVTSDYAERIAQLAERFGFDGAATSVEYAHLLHTLIEDHFDSYRTHASTDTPINFWSYFLNFNSIYWDDNIRQLVTIALCLPIGTADAERGFSILKNTLEHRPRLTADHLQSILFIRINGPSVHKFDPTSYTRYWLQTGHMHSDDTSGQTQKKASERDHDNLLDSVLF
jgi:hypothetical protein